MKRLRKARRRPRTPPPSTDWRDGSASDSSPEGYAFESRIGHHLYRGTEGCILDTSSDEDEAPQAPAPVAAPADDSDTDLEEAGKKAEDVFVCRPGSGADTDGSDTDLSAAAPAPAADDSDTDLST